MEPPAPSTLGKYQLVRRIAVGGMAEVFLAKVAGPGGFEKTVVLKRVLPHLAEDEQFIDMFRSEARLASKLNHPNVVSVFDFGQEGEDLFLVMDFIDGLTLRALYRRAFEAGTPLPFNLAAKILGGVCDGLAYAHELKDAKTGLGLDLIHRDITPDNVLVGLNGEVKVVDFGLAKSRGQLHKSGLGVVKGKYAYMSPEQLRGDPLDRRSDIFALGIVLYEVLTGTKPFAVSDTQRVAHAILFEPFAPAATLRPDVPPALQRILDRAFEKDRDRRYRDCREVLEDLEAFIAHIGEPVGPIQVAQWVTRMARPEAPTAAGLPAPATPAPVKVAAPANFPRPPPSSQTEPTQMRESPLLSHEADQTPQVATGLGASEQTPTPIASSPSGLSRLKSALSRWFRP